MLRAFLIVLFVLQIANMIFFVLAVVVPFIADGRRLRRRLMNIRKGD